MSSKVTVDGKTTWPYPRASNILFIAFAGFGLIFVGAGIRAITGGAIWAILFVLVGLCFASLGFRQIGSSEIVFDDNTQTIYIGNKRCCFTMSSTTDLGPYSAFREVVFKEELKHDSDGDRRMMYSLDFVFADGIKNNGEADSSRREMKVQTAESINKWWRETEYYKANPVTQVTQPVQVVVQSTAAVPMVAGGTQIVYQNGSGQTGQPVVQPVQGQPVQVVYVQQPVAGQPVTMQPVQGQTGQVTQVGQPQVVYAQPVAQPVQVVQQQASVAQGQTAQVPGDAPPPSYEAPPTWESAQ